MLLRLQYLALAVFAIGALFWAAGEMLVLIGLDAASWGAFEIGMVSLCISVAIGLPAAILYESKPLVSRRIRARFAAQAAALRVRAGR